jgi:mono/diheme cytochrome c family protein
MRRALAIVFVSASGAASAAPPQKDLDFFESKIRPILVEHCQSCHGPKKQSGGLRLDTFEGFTAGADNGPVVVAGKPDESRMILSVRRVGEYAMPPKAAIPPEQVALLADWVKRGAVYPPTAVKTASKPDAKSHWAYQPVTDPPLPSAAGRTEIDRFVNEKLAAAKLSPVGPADRRTLIRRLSFDLIGLPPTYAEIEAFVNDRDPRAVEKVVDRLLASPHFGERWGRHWLDVARYADSKGYVFTEDRNYPYAYTYRDYVIRSFNDDKPYDRFVTEQLAADKMDRKGDDKPLAALGFLTLGRRFLNNQHDIIDDRIDVVTRGLMGLTVGCARCHDHKYDPIPIGDYYSLYGVFASSQEPKDPPLLEPKTKEHLAFEAELAKKEKAAQDYADKMYAEGLAPFRTATAVKDYLLAVRDGRDKSPKDLDQLLISRKLRQEVYNRWKAYLSARGRGRDEVFAMWLACDNLSPGEFHELAPAMIEGLRLGGVDLHPAVVKAFEASPPKSITDVAATYGKILEEGAKANDRRLRDVLYGTDGPPSLPIPADADKVVAIEVKRGYRLLRNDAQKFRATSPAAPARAMALLDKESPTQPVVFLRGNPANRGPQVPRQFPAVVSGPDRKPFSDGSGRLDLAKAIVDRKNPLTTRVYVNRVWAHLFGEGLVRTPSDFGVRSDPPTHPPLLDWLASRFAADGLKTKSLIRRIVLSDAYQRQSDPPAGAANADPANMLLSYQSKKRHDFETLRDSILFAAGALDETTYGRSVDLFATPFTTRRTLYGSIDRQNLPGTLRAFDFASPDQHVPQRFETTVPQQALYLMNAPFIVAQAKSLAARAEVVDKKGTDAKVESLFRLTLGRSPTTEEKAASVEFLAPKSGWDYFRPKGPATPLEQLAQVLLWSNEFAFAE